MSPFQDPTTLLLQAATATQKLRRASEFPGRILGDNKILNASLRASRCSLESSPAVDAPLLSLVPIATDTTDFITTPSAFADGTLWSPVPPTPINVLPMAAKRASAGNETQLRLASIPLKQPRRGKH